MAAPRSKFFRFKIDEFLEIGREHVLLYIFKLGTPSKPPTECLHEFLRNLPANSSANYVRLSAKARKFAATELRQMKLDPTCYSLDISLLWKAIKMACERMAGYDSDAWTTPSDLLEYKVTAIKDHRNNSMHGPRKITEQEYLSEEGVLRNLLLDALRAAKDRYNRSTAEFINQSQIVMAEMNKIIGEILGEDALLLYRGDQLRQDLVVQANTVLKDRFMHAVNIHPMSFLSEKFDIQVESVFTEIKVTQGNQRSQGKYIPYLEILKVAQQPQPRPGPVRPQMLLVEGLAGSGKTTLVSLLISEWLKSDADRQIVGLKKYDLLLEVHCRERGITTLEGLLKNRVFEVYDRYKNIIWSLLWECKILVIIDGIDEKNEDSEKLIADILKEAFPPRSMTLLVTSRPESVMTFHQRVPPVIEISFIELVGVPKSRRKEFVTSYHRELIKVMQKNQSTAEFIEKVEQVLTREHFRMPLNLVILTWVYLHDPEAVTITTTQTELYYKHCNICREKLLERLANNPATFSTNRRTLEANVKVCREIFHREMLLALWHSQLTLEISREDRIRKTCITLHVPPEELLSAFLSLRATWTPTGLIEQYSAPHKGLQDFYAALHIAGDHSLTTPTGSVKSVLEATLGSQDLSLSSLQNVLRHAVGILHLGQYKPPNSVSQELVDLLHASGVTRGDDFLDLLDDTRSNPAVVQRVAHHFPNKKNEVTDGRIESYTALLPYLPPCRVRLIFKNEPSGFQNLYQALSRHTIEELHLNSHFQDVNTAVTTDQLLQQVLPRSDLERFTGHLSTSSLAYLPNSLKVLCLAVTDNRQACDLSPALSSLTLPHLEYLCINVPVAAVTTPAALTALPAAQPMGVTLYLMSVGEQDIARAAEIMVSLQPSSGYWVVHFPRATVQGLQWLGLVTAASQLSLKVTRALCVPEASITLDQRNEINTVCKDKLGCDFSREDEETMWMVGR